MSDCTYYAIGDVHGELAKLDDLLRFIREDATRRSATGMYPEALARAAGCPVAGRAPRTTKTRQAWSLPGLKVKQKFQ